jgi:hypothetical protein
MPSFRSNSLKEEILDMFSNRSSREFIEKFLMVAPCPVRCVQTDNGSEFAGEFEDFPRNSTRERLCRAIPEDHPRIFHRCIPD